jgi:hypothetical protein
MPKKRKKGKINWNIVFPLLFLVILIFSILIAIKYSNNSSTNEVTTNSQSLINFSFSSPETNVIEGEVYFDNISMGNTTNGIIRVPPLNETPKEIDFVGYYNNQKFKLSYYLPENYSISSENLFTYTLQNINDSINAENDNFSKSNKLHYTHMPIIYKYFNSCGTTEKNKIEYAFREITNATNSSVTFSEGDNYDLLITCATSFISPVSVVGQSDTLGEGGPTDMWGNIILKANVTFYPVIDSCGYYPFVELHEILHALGYEWNLYGQAHYPNNGNVCSLMTSGTETGCQSIYENPVTCGKPHIDQEIVDDLMNIYKTS